MKGQQIKYIKSEKLIDKAHSLIEKGDFDNALEIGKKLSAYELERGFEIQARVYAVMRKKKKQLQILLKGEKILPRSVIIKRALEICYAELGEYDKAIEYYGKGLDIAYGSIVDLHINHAINLLHLDRSDEALNIVEYIVPILDTIDTIPTVVLKSKTSECYHKMTVIEASYLLLIRIHNESGKYNKAKEIFEEFVNKYNINGFIESDDKLKKYGPGISMIYSTYAITLLVSEEMDKALELAKEAVLLNKWNEEAQYLIRKIRSGNDYSNAKDMRIMVNGKLNNSEGFFIVYYVTADNEAEALEFIKEFEQEKIRNSLEIYEVEILDKRLKKPKGVYNCSLYHNFPLEENN